MVANGVWFNSFIEGNVFVKRRGIMDHNALLFVEPMHLQKHNKLFQFFNFMIDIPGFQDVISKAWSLECNGPCYVRFFSRLKETKRLLRQLNKDHGNVSSNVSNARANLEEVQLYMINNTDITLLNLEKDLINKLNATLVEEESFFLQKSRVNWMELGDGNNSFFHHQCKANWNRNKVFSLEDNLGNMVHGQLLCANIAINYFENLLGPDITHSSFDLNNVECKVITEAQATSLCATVTDAIIYATLKKMKKNKAPGLMALMSNSYWPHGALQGLIFVLL
ncbi:uncharacterized protein LOC141680282 [Apium graveolens]|uniref:uncharacterized protein LOC141680282 n=1 Tax=Apium graveolens TaxID=4045 RepID=UPI003D79EC0B